MLFVIESLAKSGMLQKVYVGLAIRMKNRKVKNVNVGHYFIPLIVSNAGGNLRVQSIEDYV